MPLADIYFYAGAVGFVWILGTTLFGFTSAGANSGDLSNLDGGGCGGDASGGNDAGAGGDPGSADAASLGTELRETYQAGLAIRPKRLNLGLIILKVLSPSTIATFIFFFGTAGFTLLRLAPFLGALSLLPAAIAGVVGYRLSSSLTSMIASKMHVSAGYKHDDIIGHEAEITVPIPKSGLGEVTYSVSGIRDTAPARGLQAEHTFSTGQRVILSDVRDGIFYVEPLPLEAEWGTVSDTRDNLQKQ